MPTTGPHREKSRSAPERLQRSFLLYAVVSMLSACLVVATAAVIPTVEHHRRHDESQMLQALQVRTIAVEELLARAREIALQVGSRTRARRALIAYNKGALSLEELRATSEPLLTDALVRSEELEGITRLDARGRQVLQFGLPVPEGFQLRDANGLEEPVFQGPVLIEGKPRLLILTPVFANSGARAGTDIVVFDTAGLEHIFAETGGLGRSGSVALGIIRESGVEIFASRDARAGELPSFLPKNRGIGRIIHEGRARKSGLGMGEDSGERAVVVAYSRVPGTNWTALLKFDRRELYESLPDQLSLIALVVVPLVALGVFVMLRLLRPLSRQMNEHTADLRREIEERKRAEQVAHVRSHQQAVVADLGQRALEGLPSPELMDRAVTALARALRVEFAKVLELLPDGQNLLLRAGVGWADGVVGTATVGAGKDSQAGYTLLANDPVVVEDLAREERFSGSPLLQEHGIRSGASVIIRGRKAPFGILGVHSRGRRAFSDHDLLFLQAVANLLGESIERAGAEGALAENEMRLRAIFASALDPVITTNADGIVQSASDSVERCFGWHPREIQWKSIDQLFHPGFHQAYQQDLDVLTGSGERKLLDRTLEITGLRRDGSRFPCEISVSKVTLPGRSKTLFTTIIRDVSERRKSEEHNRQLLELIESSPDFIGLASLDERVLYLNRGGQRLVGIEDPKQVERTSIFDYVLPEDAEEVREHLLPEILTGSGHWQGEFRLRHQVTGEGIPVETKAFLIRNGETGEPVSIANLSTDLRGRKKAEADLRASEARFRQFVESLPQGIVVHRAGRILYVNPAAAGMLGFEPEEMRNLEMIDFVHPDERAATLELTRGIYESGTPAPLAEVTLKNREGREFTADVRALPIEFEGQRAILSVIADATERRQLQARLVQADRLASVGLLAAGVAHEINNPLTYVIANLDFVTEHLSRLSKRRTDSTGPAEETASLEELDEILREARTGAERVKVIVKDLRTFSRTDEGDSVPVDLHAVLDSTINMAYKSIRSEAPVVKDYGDSMFVAGNVARLGQVFMNLLQNAAQAIDKQRPAGNEIRVTTGRDDRGWASVEISDTGLGIDEKVLPRIFDPFFTTKPVGLGTGLGLSICRNIVNALGGEISVRSEPGEGTSVRVLLPPAEALASVPAAPRETPRAEPREKIRMLVVDDDAMLGTSLRRSLQRSHEVAVVTDGLEAIARLRVDRGFDVILCDVMMPGTSGIEVYETVRREIPEMAERFLFMTGGAFTEKARAFLEEVENPIVEKPFDIAHLRSLLDGFVRRRR